nr:hypothetical protein CFP56_07592 [Quercus suber]
MTDRIVDFQKHQPASRLSLIVRSVPSQPLPRACEEPRPREHVEEMYCAQPSCAFEKLDGVVGTRVADAGEQLRVDDEAFEIWQRPRERGQEAGGVAEREEFEREGFDRGGQRRDAEGRRVSASREQCVIAVERDLGRQRQGFEPGGRRREGGEMEGLQRDLGAGGLGGVHWVIASRRPRRQDKMLVKTVDHGPRRRHRALSREPPLRPGLLPEQAHAHGGRDVDAARDDGVEGGAERRGGRAVPGLMHDGVCRCRGAAEGGDERGERARHGGHQELHRGGAGVCGRGGGRGKLGDLRSGERYGGEEADGSREGWGFWRRGGREEKGWNS